VYHPPDGKPATFTFRGIVYAFEPDKRVDFASWKLVLDLADEMRQISFRLARDPMISSQAAIADSWSSEVYEQSG
jgi:hypothetical protein